MYIIVLETNINNFCGFDDQNENSRQFTHILPI